MSKNKNFPDPHEYVRMEIPPELEGWEEMYPPHFLFGEERKDWEKQQFWYLDKIHAVHPMPPLDQVFQQAWQISLAQHTTRIFCIPPAQGIAHRMVGCYQYICAIAPPSQEVIMEKAKLFGERAQYPVDHYDEIFAEWLEKVQALGKEMQGIEVPKELPKYLSPEDIFPNHFKGYTPAYELMESFDRAVNYIYKAWQYHFNYLNLSYLYYLMFFDVAKKLFPGISDSAVSKMVAGAEVSMFRPEEELCRLARLAHENPQVSSILRQVAPAKEKISELSKFAQGEKWLKELEDAKEPWFNISCGSGWYYYEGSWKSNLDVPFGYLKNYLERLEKGESIERSLADISAARDEIVAQYTNLIKNEDDKKTFLDAHNNCRVIYKYAEDHLFWIEHWFHNIWWAKVREIGQVLVKCGALKETDDIFMFNRLEVPTLIEDAVTTWALGEDIPMLKWSKKAEKRKKILEDAFNWTPSPALGPAPEEVAEPFTIMLWGVTTDKVDDWLTGSAVNPDEVTLIKGFAASSGVVEGIARVIKTTDEISLLKAGEIMVCPCTNPSWAPVLSTISAAVTDIGGLTSHAAIVCREYSLPSVTGTGIATVVIKTGDLIRVDGDEGTVEIIQRAEADPEAS
jgi:pyruvate,water dikinase